MPRLVRLALAATAGVVGLILLGVLALQWPEWRFAATVEAIELGTPREVVVERLGAPGYEGDDCYVAQFIRFEKPSQRVVAHRCAHWMGPFNFYAVGFGPDNKVVWVAYGDS